MKFKDILKKVGLGVVTAAFPAAAPLIGVVNSFLPDDKKLPENATGNQVQGALDSMKSEDRARILEAEINVEIQEIKSHEGIQKALSEADAQGASTRPFIALMMAWVVTLTVCPLAWVFVYAVIAGEPEIIKAISDNYLMALAMIGTPTTLLVSYFGMRTKEKQSRYAVAHGQPIPPNPLGLLGKILK